MKNKQQFIASLLALELSMSANASTVVTFEDISPNDLADGYGGISGWGALGGTGIDDKAFGGNGLYAFWGNEGMISFDQAPVVFRGTYYKAFPQQQDYQTPLTAIELWYQGSSVSSFQYTGAPLQSMVWLGSGYTGLVDHIYFRGGISGFSIDDLTYESVNSVPIPASWALFVDGVALLGFAPRRSASPVQGRNNENYR